MSHCKHEYLSSSVMDSMKALYRPPAAETIRDALAVKEPARKKMKRSGESKDVSAFKENFVPPESGTFPAPVVVSGDLLFEEPDYPPQTVQDCLDVRNEVTSSRRTVYVVTPPSIAPEVEFLENCTKPVLPRAHQDSIEDSSIDPPTTEHVTDYLRAFYHGLLVKQLKAPFLQYTTWEDPSTSKRPPRKAKLQPPPSYIALATSTSKTRIRCRASPDKTFQTQLNLNDILDVALSLLPGDAYAVLMLVHHDLYEDEDDDFCCGRAYGGSRVAVVSTARYNPILDVGQNVDREHSWPGAHCMTWLATQYTRKALVYNYLTPAKDLVGQGPGSAVAAAVLAEGGLSLPSSDSELGALWLGRVCKTASHELGHCFGMDHCMYYACIMQGTASLAEDVRQPPYLCPVDLAKLLRATATSEKERYEALLQFCARWKEDRMFAAFGAWLEMRLGQPDAITV